MKLFNLIIALLFVSSICFGQSSDKLSKLRTEKKIVTENTVAMPYYAIQILALQEPPREPGYFKNIDSAREFVCSDGFTRYVVGEYAKFSEAVVDLQRIIDLGYPGAFVVNTKKLLLSDSGYSSTNKLVIDPGKSYLVQLSAFRFPVYVSYFEQFDKVLEFYMKDKIYRYCVGVFQGTEVASELSRVKSLGYKDAFIVENDKYLPFKIE